MPVGDVTPFVVTEVTARNYIGSGARFQFLFSKPVPESLTNGVSDWLEITPCPTNLMAQAGWRSLTLLRGLQGPDLVHSQTAAAFQVLRRVRLGRLKHLHALDAAGSRRGCTSPPFRVTNWRAATALFRCWPLTSPRCGYGPSCWTLKRPSTPCAATEVISPPGMKGGKAVSWDEPYRPVNYNLVPGRTVFDDSSPSMLLQTRQRSSTSRGTGCWPVEKPASCSWTRNEPTVNRAARECSARKRSFN